MKDYLKERNRYNVNDFLFEFNYLDVLGNVVYDNNMKPKYFAKLSRNMS